MDEYIKRDTALLAISYYPIENQDPGDITPAVLETARKAIAKINAADVAPVRHGRWIDGDPYCPICRKDKFRGLDADVWSDWKPDYCPNCGCRMDLEE